MNLARLTFLVVDDVPAMCQITANQLRALGAENIITAGNGADALRLLQTRQVDLVLSDWNMPLMDGLELLRHIRASAELADIPMVMVTAEADRDRIAQAINSGVSDLLVKPYTRQRLEDKVANALSRRARPVGEPLAPLAQPAPTPRPTLLVVDDTPDNLRLIADLFDGQYRVKVAHNGPKALAMCTSDSPPDLVLLDVMMPGMDGFEVAQRMREHPASAHIPIVFVTALTDDAARRKGLSLGAVDFVSKPLDPDLLQLRVQNFMRHIAIHMQRQAEYDVLLENARLREEVERMLRHDIKGPLAGVLGMAQQLASASGLAPDHAMQAGLIAATAQQALDTVQLSSDLFMIETGNYRLEPVAVDVAAILHQVAGSARAAYAAAGNVQITIDAPLSGSMAAGDPTLVQAVVYNLVKNACEAAAPGGHVAISLLDSQPMLVTVTNTGAVPPAMRERFFDRYASSGKRQGTGLGTYSAKLLTEAMHGGVTMATDDAQNRTTLTITLPAYNT
ncbi:response regulator [Duganella sp. FT92W]|uniref:Response regulator n=1 Tax=Pseudoduganella rivuli TaxID=2666085 RepID=A0A7X2ILW3_9BURK|nr:hybrid sensor histidine kinase/response regulator [Pseudoduganella rivuli]MRV72426.1 response regulator [Pseudoduganella rivuli]